MAKCQAGTSSFRKCSKLLKPWLLTNKDCVYLCTIRDKSCAIDFKTKSVFDTKWKTESKFEISVFYLVSKGLKVNCTWSGPKSLCKIISVCKLHCTHLVRIDLGMISNVTMISLYTALSTLKIVHYIHTRTYRLTLVTDQVRFLCKIGTLYWFPIVCMMKSKMLRRCMMTLAKLTQKYVLIVMERVSEIGKKLHSLSKFWH